MLNFTISLLIFKSLTNIQPKVVVVITETVYASTCACECLDGFQMVGGVCEEICDDDQCLDASICGANSECTNLCSGYECSCQTGYHLEGDSCVVDVRWIYFSLKEF